MRLAATMLLTLKGTPCLYQGEEIGMGQGRIPRKQLQDPSGKRYWPFFRGRDGARTPLQWDTNTHAGFTTGKPWLPVNPDYPTRNFSQQRTDPRSLLHLYRALIQLRRAHPALSKGEIFLPPADHPHVLTWARTHGNERLRICLNLSARPQRWPILDEQPIEALFSTHDPLPHPTAPLELRPHEGLILSVDNLCEGHRETAPG